jgi:hypothetical protein
LCRGPDLLRPQHLNQTLRRSRKCAVLHRHPCDRVCLESARSSRMRNHGRSTAT